MPRLRKERKTIVFRHHVMMRFSIDFPVNVARDKLANDCIRRGYVPMNIKVKIWEDVYTTKAYLIVSCMSGFVGKIQAKKIGVQKIDDTEINIGIAKI